MNKDKDSETSRENHGISLTFIDEKILCWGHYKQKLKSQN